MTHVINSELFKLRTTRTFIALVGVALGRRAGRRDPRSPRS